MKNYSVEYLGSREALEKKRLHNVRKSLSPVAAILSPTSSLTSLTKEKVDVQLIVTNKQAQDVDRLEYQKPAYVAVCLVMVVTLFVVLFPMLVTSQVLGMLDSVYSTVKPPRCHDKCVYGLVESIPENLTYPDGSPTHPTTYSVWKNLISIATESIDIGSFYWTLKRGDIYRDDSDWQGNDIYYSLISAAKNRKIKIRIAQSEPQENLPNTDTEELEKLGVAEVRSLNFTRWFGTGILHSKLWIIDNKHFYVGSANMDWRALTQVKEMGAVVYNCSCLAQDMAKIFRVYWEMGDEGADIPQNWSKDLSTLYNVETPMEMKLNNTESQVYISSSPPEFCPRGRTSDIDAIVDIIDKAEEYVYIAVMDYFPATTFRNPNIFWPKIDDALKRAAFDRHVDVRLLASHWKHTENEMLYFLKSLSEFSGAAHYKVQVKMFEVPAFTDAQRNIPFCRVNHNKYMVTDSVAYIGTSNWSGDYFISTGGIGLIVNQTMATENTSSQQHHDNSNQGEEERNQFSNTTFSSNHSSFIIQKQLTEVFLRDWDSQYAHSVWNYNTSHKENQVEAKSVIKEEL